MEQEEDRLSNLPKIILHNILSRLLEEDAARTSVLSKTWLEIWYTFPNLCFCDSQFIGKSTQPLEDIVDTKVVGMFSQPMDDLPKTRKDFIDYVNSRLARFWKQGLAIKEFNLYVNCFELGYMSRDVDLWLKLASESGVEVLNLDNDIPDKEEGQGEYYVLPKSVIEAKSLTKLLLMGKIRVDQAFMNHSIKFFSLRELNLCNVHLEDEQAIEHLISHCPLMESITLIFYGANMKLSMHGLQKLKTVYINGIKEVYIDEAPNIQSLYYCSYLLDTPFKVDFIRCKNLKELTLCFIDRTTIITTIITDKWFLELFTKFPFLETLHMQNFAMSEKINISSVQLKNLKFSNYVNLKEANIDAPNLLLCGFQYGHSKPIISFSRISSELVVLVEINLRYFNVCYMREVLQNIKHQNVIMMVSLYISKRTVGATNPMLLDISSPPPRIKHIHLQSVHVPIDETFLDISVVVDYFLLYCVPTTISFSFDISNRAFIEFLHEKLMRRKDEDCFCNSSNTKCWWHNLKDVKVTSSMEIHKNADLKTILESLSTDALDDYRISFRLEF